MNIRNMNKEELYKFVLPTLLEINKGYLYLKLDDKKIEDIFKKFIYDVTKSYQENEDYLSYIKEVIEEKYQQMIIEAVKKDPLKLVDNYVSLSYVDKNNLREIIEFLRKFDDFLESISFYDNDDLVFDVVRNNKVINSLLKIVVDKVTTDKKYRYLKNNPKLESLIEVYALINQIYLEEIEEEKESIAKNNYKVEDFFRGDYLDMERMYSREIRKIRLLTYQEEIELGKRIQNGDKEAINILVEHNLRWVDELAYRFLNKGLPLDDLRQEGNLGLWVAASKFDPTKGYKFSTYATWWIKHYIQRGIMDKGRLIRIPIHTNVNLFKYLKQKENLFRKLGHEPNAYEMKDEYGMSLDYIDLMEQVALDPASLDKPVGEEDDEYSLLETIASKETSDNAGLDLFEEILKGVNLTEKEKDILRRRYAYGQTGEEVGLHYNVTRQRIDQIEKRAFSKILNNPKKSKELAIYAEQLSINKNARNSKNNNAKKIDLIRDIIVYTNKAYEDNNGEFIGTLKKLNFTKLDCLFIVLKYVLKMHINDISKHKFINKEACNETLEKINQNITNKELNYYLNNSELITQELKVQDTVKDYYKIVLDDFSKSSFIDKIKFLISYYFSFPDNSRFIYILKSSNIEYNEAVFLILKYIFDLDEISMSLKGFKLKNLNSIDKKCLMKIKNSLYKDEICNYLSNSNLVLEELKLKDLKEKQFVKRP